VIDERSTMHEPDHEEQTSMTTEPTTPAITTTVRAPDGILHGRMPYEVGPLTRCGLPLGDDWPEGPGDELTTCGDCMAVQARAGTYLEKVSTEIHVARCQGGMWLLVAYALKAAGR
jgi:hypothetical protein